MILARFRVEGGVYQFDAKDLRKIHNEALVDVFRRGLLLKLMGERVSWYREPKMIEALVQGIDLAHKIDVDGSDNKKTQSLSHEIMSMTQAKKDKTLRKAGGYIRRDVKNPKVPSDSLLINKYERHLKDGLFQVFYLNNDAVCQLPKSPTTFLSNAKAIISAYGSELRDNLDVDYTRLHKRLGRLFTQTWLPQQRPLSIVTIWEAQEADALALKDRWKKNDDIGNILLANQIRFVFYLFRLCLVLVENKDAGTFGTNVLGFKNPAAVQALLDFLDGFKSLEEKEQQQQLLNIIRFKTNKAGKLVPAFVDQICSNTWRVSKRSPIRVQRYDGYFSLAAKFEDIEKEQKFYQKIEENGATARPGKVNYSYLQSLSREPDDVFDEIKGGHNK
jgi:hypothetical protein